jgi:hypothetical protein
MNKTSTAAPKETAATVRSLGNYDRAPSGILIVEQHGIKCHSGREGRGRG